MKQELEQAAGDYIVQLNGEDLEGGFNAAFNAFKAGAKWAIEKAAEWLFDNICNYDVRIDEVEFTDDFKEFMEEKK